MPDSNDNFQDDFSAANSDFGYKRVIPMLVINDGDPVRNRVISKKNWKWNFLCDPFLRKTHDKTTIPK